MLKRLALAQFFRVHLQPVRKFFSSAFIYIVLVNTQVNSTLIEFSVSVIVYQNVLVSAKIKINKVMCENKQMVGHTPICIVFIHSVFRGANRRC